MPMPTARNRLAARLKPKLTGAAERSLKAVPFVRAKLEREYAKLIAGMGLVVPDKLAGRKYL